MRKRKAGSNDHPELNRVPLLVHTIPHNIYGEPEHLQKAIDAVLSDLCNSLLAANEREEWSKWQVGQGRLSEAASRKIDTLILTQAETFGWRLVLSQLVQRRFSGWDYQTNGPELCKRFGTALARSARILQGREQPPLDDPGLYEYKIRAVGELGAALTLLGEGAYT